MNKIPDGYARVSVANLITEIQLVDQTPVPFVVRHPLDLTKPWQHLSAGPKFPQIARNCLWMKYAAQPSEFSGNDARCAIPEQWVSDFRQWLEDQFLNPTPVMDWDPTPELQERLTLSYWKGLTPPLVEKDFQNIALVSLDLVRQPSPENNEARGGRGSNVRFFRRWRMIVNAQTGAKLANFDGIKMLVAKDLLSTRGGRRIGTCGAFELANNVGVDNCTENS